jgi:hypothetical protein
LFLGGFDLTPTFRDVNKKFSTRYYLSLVLIDEGKSPTPEVIECSLMLTGAPQMRGGTSSNPRSSSIGKRLNWPMLRAKTRCRRHHRMTSGEGQFRHDLFD